MSVSEWLPITGRNRVALCLAGLSLVMFAVWNCLPLSLLDDEVGGSTGIIASVFWSTVFSPDVYLTAIRSPGLWEFLMVAICLATLSGGLVILLTIPLWEMLHASPYLKLPVAWLNLAGGVAWCCLAILFFSLVREPGSGYMSFLMSLSLFSISASFFLFQNELMLREAKKHAATSGKD
jgi:hypothetical protein